jgi:hypothetical protein
MKLLIVFIILIGCGNHGVRASVEEKPFCHHYYVVPELHNCKFSNAETVGAMVHDFKGLQCLNVRNQYYLCETR